MRYHSTVTFKVEELSVGDFNNRLADNIVAGPKDQE